MGMMDWNEYRRQVLASIEIGKGYRALGGDGELNKASLPTINAQP
jgi:hypothetical protein